MNMRKLIHVAAIGAATVFAISGCGEDEESKKPGGSGKGGSGGAIAGMGGEPDTTGGTAGATGGRGGSTGGSSGASGTAGTAGATGGTSGATSGMGGEGGEGGPSCMFTECDTECVDTATSTVHCNACNRPCSEDNTTDVACVDGACEPTCDSGYDDCNVDNGGDDDGCETDIDGTISDCGACNRACGISNTTALACTGGACRPTCSVDYGDCNVDDGNGADDGCETHLDANATCGTSCANAVACATSDFCVDGTCRPTCPNTVCDTACVVLATANDHCGMCNRACSAVNAMSRSCAAGRCAPVCATGFRDCVTDDGNGFDDGCETDVRVTTGSCGSCGRSCGATNTTAVSCAAGLCTPTCAATYGDCAADDGNGADDGCETDLDEATAHCGTCGRACAASNTTAVDCNSGACDPTCAATYGDCNVDDGSGPDDGCETDLDEATGHCGACGRACDMTNATALDCNSGVCAPTCAPTYADCLADDGSGADDGCETDLDEATGHCGACGRACASTNTTALDCNSGACDPTCATGFADCSLDDGSGPDDGCETNTNATASDCGTCGRACSTANTTAVSCTGGECAPTCAADFGDCNVDDGSGADDGCETNFNANTTCGTSCGNTVACPQGEICVDGACELDCPYEICGAICVDTDITTAHCGACSRACDATNTASLSCDLGICEPVCADGFGDCLPDDGSGADDGCETDLNDEAACGLTCGTRVACGVDETCVDGVCTCLDTVCGLACVDLQDDESHCGACNHACLDGANESATTCSAGVCTPTCEAGFGNCSTPQSPAADDGCETNLNSTATCGTTCLNAVACGLGASCSTSVCRNQGVVRCEVPLDNMPAGEGQRYNLLHRGPTNNPPEAPILDLAGTSVVFRVWAPNATSGNLRVTFWSNGTESFSVAAPFTAPFTAFDDAFTDITVPVPAAAGSWNPSQVGIIRIEIEAAGTGPWLNPTIVYIDSITSLNGNLNDTFNTTPIAGLFSRTGTRDTTPPAPQATWLNLLPP
jgi:hypothetical protein